MWTAITKNTISSSSRHPSISHPTYSLQHHSPENHHALSPSLSHRERILPISQTDLPRWTGILLLSASFPNEPSIKYGGSLPVYQMGMVIPVSCLYSSRAWFPSNCVDLGNVYRRWLFFFWLGSYENRWGVPFWYRILDIEAYLFFFPFATSGSILYFILLPPPPPPPFHESLLHIYITYLSPLRSSPLP